VSTLNPKWGGSFEAMDKLLELAETAKMPANEIRYLNYKIELEKANYYSVVTEQKTLAASHYELAGGFCENRWIWEKIVQTSYETSDWPKLIEAADRLIKIEPANGYAFQRRGWAFEKTNQMARAVKDYEIAAKLGLPWAQNKLGWILWQGIDLPKDLPRAKKLFLKATGQGDEYAKANLKALNAVLGE
jgi:TPR repeat protein